MPHSKKVIEDTGERMVPEYNAGTIVYGEHMARYHSVEPYTKGKIVLDIASGSGYGTALIASTAAHVYGVDISSEAVEYSKKHFQKKNVEFVVGDGKKIPLDSGSVDVVVSFETIEHIEDYKSFMKEVKRVLKSDGKLILSTPNDDEYSEGNHFHVHEFRLKELKDLIRQYYKHDVYLYQYDWLYSALLPASLTGKKEWSSEILTYQYAAQENLRAIYFTVIASDIPISPDPLPLGVLAEHWSELIKHKNEQVFKKHMDEQAAIIDHLEKENVNKSNILLQLERREKELIAELDKIRNSKVWVLAEKSRSVKKS